MIISNLQLEEIINLKDKYSDRVVKLEELEDIWEREVVLRIEDNSYSGRDPSWIWHTVYFIDNTEMQVYIKL